MNRRNDKNTEIKTEECEMRKETERRMGHTELRERLTELR